MTRLEGTHTSATPALTPVRSRVCIPSAEEELAAIKDDLTLSGLNFRFLRMKQLRKWRFFTVTAILMTFAAFQVRMTAPVYEPTAPSKLGHDNGFRDDAIAATIANDVAGMTDFLNRESRQYYPIFKVPKQSVWLYVDGTFAHLSTALDLAEERASRVNSTSTHTRALCQYDGWRRDGGPYEWPIIAEHMRPVLELLW